jgi:hypothetical protein
MPKTKTSKKIETNISLPGVNIVNDDIFAQTNLRKLFFII